jgi:hypothetical protein
MAAGQRIAEARVAWAAGLALPIALAIGGCAPVDAWRSLSGVDKNDPDPRTAPFTGNLAAGEAAPYPNLASVPPPPTHATTTAERQKLTQSLIADRNAAEAAGGTSSGASPGLPTPAPSVPKASRSGAAEAKALPGAAQGATAPLGPGAAQGATAPLGPTATNSPQSGRRAAGEPPDPSPQNSTLEVPQVRLVPEPETARPAPPTPALAAAPRPAPAPPMPAAVAATMPEPAPPVPDLAPAATPQTSVRAQPKRAPVATTVATLDIPVAGGAAPPDRAQIERVATLYRDNPGTVRVIGYAAAPAVGGGTGGGDPLGNYHAALDRAQGIARALAEAGIPAGKIQTEATPAGGARSPGRIEIQFTQ